MVWRLLRPSLLAPVFVVLSTSPTLAVAQAVLKGTVRSDSAAQPLAGVEVIAEGSVRQTVSDRSGRYLLTGLPFGPRSVLFRSVGFAPVLRGVILLKDDTVHLDVTMARGGTAQELPPVEVTSRPEPASMGLRDGFEERRRLGFGKFIDSTVLRRNEHRRLADLLRGIPGIAFVLERRLCRGTQGGFMPPGGRCGPAELRAMSGRSGRGCYTTIFLDGHVFYRSDDSPMSRPPPDWNHEFFVTEVEKVEVYRSAAELPNEFSGASSQCGVIVLWSRRGG